MAKFEPKVDIDNLSLDFQKLSNLSNDDIWQILTPAADLLVRKLKEKIKTFFKQHTGKLAASIEGFRKGRGKESAPHILVYPYGTHHRYKGRKKTGHYKRSKHGRTYTYGGGSKQASANDVAFVLEYGAASRNIPATHWMEKTINENSEAVAEAMQQGFDDYIKNKGVDL